MGVLPKNLKYQDSKHDAQPFLSRNPDSIQSRDYPRGKDLYLMLQPAIKTDISRHPRRIPTPNCLIIFLISFSL